MRRVSLKRERLTIDRYQAKAIDVTQVHLMMIPTPRGLTGQPTPVHLVNSAFSQPSSQPRGAWPIHFLNSDHVLVLLCTCSNCNKRKAFNLDPVSTLDLGLPRDNPCPTPMASTVLPEALTSNPPTELSPGNTAKTTSLLSMRAVSFDTISSVKVQTGSWDPQMPRFQLVLNSKCFASQIKRRQSKPSDLNLAFN